MSKWVVHMWLSLRARLSVGLILIAAPVLAQDEERVRGQKVVPERPARVFVMAGFDAACKSLTPVEVIVTKPPTQGQVSLREGQETVVQYSLTGNCKGRRVIGTGIYYTAAKGAVGQDTFAVSARVGRGGEPATRTFTVRIAED
jgi:hypothetical protein